MESSSLLEKLGLEIVSVRQPTPLDVIIINVNVIVGLHKSAVKKVRHISSSIELCLLL
jgi:hypothetical protein